MPRKRSSLQVEWCFCSTWAACMRLRWVCRMALGKPVVPLEKYIAASSSSERMTLGFALE